MYELSASLSWPALPATMMAVWVAHHLRQQGELQEACLPVCGQACLPAHTASAITTAR